ncbi:MAG: hypothetical protein JXB47_13740 [Anaerolineae bacterium]|nr:hypothetical protein [Anaerolineae bacterium]
MAQEQEKKWTSEGKCVFCGETFSKRGIGRHLKTCKARKAAYEAEPGKGKARPKKFFHLKVEGEYASNYWMHLDIAADATLQALDQFLRDTWLECCGHLSAFRIEGTDYFGDPYTVRELGGRSMNTRLDKVLKPGVSFRHEYDFGSTTELKLDVVDEREGVAGGKRITVMARNDPPPIVCQACGERLATQVCNMCSWEGVWLCDECAPEHECGEDVMLPVVNSPRVGVCGYAG